MGFCALLVSLRDAGCAVLNGPVAWNPCGIGRETVADRLDLNPHTGIRFACCAVQALVHPSYLCQIGGADQGPICLTMPVHINCVRFREWSLLLPMRAAGLVNISIKSVQQSWRLFDETSGDTPNFRQDLESSLSILRPFQGIAPLCRRANLFVLPCFAGKMNHYRSLPEALPEEV